MIQKERAIGQKGQEVHPLGHCVGWVPGVGYLGHSIALSAAPILKAPPTLPSPVILSLESLRTKVLFIHTALSLRALGFPSLMAGGHSSDSFVAGQET